MENKLQKLPKWAQEAFNNLQRERDTAVRALNKYLDNETESPIFQEDVLCTGENKGPTFKKRYIQGRRISVDHCGIEVGIYLDDDRIQVIYNGKTGKDAYIKHPSSNCIELVSIERVTK